MSERLHLSESHRRTECAGNGENYGHVRVREGYASENNAVEAYYDLNANDGTPEPRLIIPASPDSPNLQEGRIILLSHDANSQYGDEVAEIRALRQSLSSSGETPSSVCRQFGPNPLPPSAQVSPTENSPFPAWMLGLSLGGQVLGSAVCYVSPVVRRVDGFEGSFNDILAGSFCLGAQGLGAANAQMAPRATRTAHTVSTAIQGGIFLASAILLPTFYDPAPSIIVGSQAATTLASSELHRVNPLAGNLTQVGLGAAMFIPGLSLVLADSTPPSSYYRAPGTMPASSLGSPTDAQRRMGLGLTVVGGLNLAVGGFFTVWDLTHPATPRTANRLTLAPLVTDTTFGVFATGTF